MKNARLLALGSLAWMFACRAGPADVLDVPVAPVVAVNCRDQTKELGVVRIGEPTTVSFLVPLASDQQAGVELVQTSQSGNVTVQPTVSEVDGETKRARVDLTILPTEVGQFEVVSKFESRDACGTTQMVVRGVGAAESVVGRIDADFGYAPVGSVTVRSLTVDNLGSGSVTIASAKLDEGTAFSAQVVQSQVDGLSSSKVVELTFRPGQPQLFSDTLRLDCSGATHSVLIFPVRGKGGGPKLQHPVELTVGTTPVRLAGTSDWSWREVLIENTGVSLPNDPDGVLEVFARASSSSDLLVETSFDSSDASVRLGPGATSHLRLRYAPLQVGPFQSAIRLEQPDGSVMGAFSLLGDAELLAPDIVFADRSEVVFDVLDGGSDPKIVALRSLGTRSLLANVRVVNNDAGCYSVASWPIASSFVSANSPAEITVTRRKVDGTGLCDGRLEWSQAVPNRTESSVPIRDLSP